jgi:hypothetical protein
MSLKLCSSATHSYMVSQIREAAVQYILYYAALCLCNKMLWSRILTVIVKFGVGKKPWLFFRIIILQIDRNDDRCNFQFNSSTTRYLGLLFCFLLISHVMSHNVVFELVKIRLGKMPIFNEIYGPNNVQKIYVIKISLLNHNKCVLTWIIF